MEKIEFHWKPATEIPTEHWERNHAISPLYLVKCGIKNGVSVVGYTRYSFVGKCWMDCYNATEEGLWKVQAWTDVKL